MVIIMMLIVIDDSNNTIIKVKGFSSDKIKYSELKSLLIKDNFLSIKSSQFKTVNFNIIIFNINKLLTSTINLKRLPVYIDNILVDTKPLIYNVSSFNNFSLIIKPQFPIETNC